MDFQFDSDNHGKQVKILNVVDEFTRQHVGFRVGRKITAIDVIETLDVCSIQYGARPEVLRMDNGPELISQALATWAAEQDTGTVFIPAGQPWHNGYVESLHNRMRDELLEDNVFDDCQDLERCLASWSKRYNHLHPHSGLGYQTPNDFAATWHRNNNQQTPDPQIALT